MKWLRCAAALEDVAQDLADLGPSDQPGGSNTAVFVEEMIRRAARAASDAAYRIRLRCMPYKEYLKSAHWQRVRATALEHATGCQLCDSAKKLNVHHRYYHYRGLEDEHPQCLIVLCRDCHAKFHDKLPKGED